MGKQSPTFGLDTNFLVAVLCDWHEFHAATRTAYQDLRRGGARFIVAAQALLECFSVLTRMPPPYRFSPEKALRLFRENLSGSAAISGVDPQLCWLTIRELSQQGLGGGLVYDAVIARSVRQAGATVLLTWNVRDFLLVAPPGLQIREP